MWGKLLCFFGLHKWVGMSRSASEYQCSRKDCGYIGMPYGHHD